MKATKQQKADALARLHELIKPGDTVYTVLDHVSRSGMLRLIRLIVIVKNEPIDISSYADDLLGWGYRDGALVVTGCGMDEGFHAVYSLSSLLYADGFRCIGEGCPSNDHSNGDPRGYSTSKTHIHRDGGYALRQSWL